MKDALKLMQEYKKKQEVKPVSVAQEFAPILSQLLSALAEIVNKDIPAPLVEFTAPEVKVELENPIQVNVPKQPEQKTPIVNIHDYDYTKMFSALKESVDRLTIAVASRPTAWDVERNSQGFIQTVKAVKSEE